MHASEQPARATLRSWCKRRHRDDRTDDPQALTRVVFTLIDITVAVMLAERLEAGRTEEEARAEAIEWLDAQAAHTEIELLDSGVVFNPAASVLGTGHLEQTGR